MLKLEKIVKNESINSILPSSVSRMFQFWEILSQVGKQIFLDGRTAGSQSTRKCRAARWGYSGTVWQSGVPAGNLGGRMAEEWASLDFRRQRRATKNAYAYASCWWSHHDVMETTWPCERDHQGRALDHPPMDSLLL